MDVINILLEITIYSGIIFIATMLLKKCFKKSMSPFLHYAVWAVLILRLITPVTIASPVHLFVIPDTAQNQTVSGDYADAQAYKPAAEPQTNNDGLTAFQEPQAAALSEPVPSQTEPKMDTRVQLSIPQIIILIWLSGAVLSLMYLAVLYAVLRRRFRRNAACPSKRLSELFEEVKAELGIKAIIKLVCQYEYGTPSIMFPKTLMMPIDALVAMNDEQAKFALRHELTHFKRRDHIVSIFLSFLNAVYWFNPFVWLAVRQIRTDMEIACDSAVVKRLNADGRRRYASLVVNLFSQPVHKQLVLGMAQADAKKVAERRVRGIFMNGKSGRSVKLITALLAVIMLLTCFTTACQPTPSSAPVVNKGDNHLESMIASSAVSEEPSGSADKQDSSALAAALRSKTGAPESLKDSYTNKKGDVRVAIDAKVEVPSVDSIPALEVKTTEFTQDTVDKLAAYFLKDAQTYKEEQVRTKDEIEEEIVQQQQIEEYKGDKIETEFQSQLNDLKKQYKEAPETRKRTPATTKLYKTKDGTELMLVADLGKDGEATFNVFNVSSSEYTGSEFYYINDGKGFYEYESELKVALKGIPRGMTTTLEDAQKKACQCLSDLEINNMQVDTVSAGTYMRTDSDLNDKTYVSTAKQCYVFEFQKMINGIPVLNIEASTPMSTDDPSVPAEKQPQYANEVGPESLTVYVDDTGIVKFMWNNPSGEESVLSEHVTLSKFDDIAKKARDNMFYKNYTAYGSTCDIKITRVKLSMMRIMEKDKPGRYMIVPVWDYIGNNGLPFGDQSFVTINAIDGSNINRQLSY